MVFTASEISNHMLAVDSSYSCCLPPNDEPQTAHTVTIHTKHNARYVYLGCLAAKYNYDEISKKNTFFITHTQVSEYTEQVTDAVDGFQFVLKHWRNSTLKHDPPCSEPEMHTRSLCIYKKKSVIKEIYRCC